MVGLGTGFGCSKIQRGQLSQQNTADKAGSETTRRSAQMRSILFFRENGAGILGVPRFRKLSNSLSDALLVRARHVETSLLDTLVPLYEYLMII